VIVKKNFFIKNKKKWDDCMEYYGTIYFSNYKTEKSKLLIMVKKFLKELYIFADFYRNTELLHYENGIKICFLTDSIYTKVYRTAEEFNIFLKKLGEKYHMCVDACLVNRNNKSYCGDYFDDTNKW